MAKKLTIYNLQKMTSESGNEYVGRAVAFKEGKRGVTSEKALKAPFYIRDRRTSSGEPQWITLDAQTLDDAKIEAAKIVAHRVAAASGVVIVDEAKPSDLRSKITEYLVEIKANRSKATWDVYRRSCELFQESCHKELAEDVKRTDMLSFKTFLKNKDFSGRTIYNHFLNITVLFVWIRKKTDTLGLADADWPEKEERDPEAYSAEELNMMLETAAGTWKGLARKKDESRDDRLLLWAFLNSGMRDGELSHLTYGDIDTKHSIWKVRPTEEHALKTVGSKRDVPVGEWLTKKIMAGKTKGTDYIFGTEKGKVDGHLIRITQRVAELAGITGRVDNHKFRATAITMWLRNGATIPDVMGWVGHTSTATLLRYAAKLNLEKAENRRKATSAFDHVANMGD